MSQVLVVIDMQNDFITGSLGTKEAIHIVSKVIDKIKEYKGKQIIFTRDTHFEDYLSSREGKNLPIEHCIKGTWGWEIQEEIKAVIPEESLIYDKVSFGSCELAEHIKQLGETSQDLEVELVGLCTDICVVSNALLIKAYTPETSIKVDVSCCAGVTPEAHEAALKTMASCQIELVNQ